MAYSEQLAGRVRDQLAREARITERAMFGGLAFLWAGNMVCGTQRDDLMVRVGPDLFHDALTRPHAREMEFTGRSMKGFVTVGPHGLADDKELELWVRLGLAHARTFPPKKAPARKKAAPAKKKAGVRTRKAAAKKAAAKRRR